MIIDLNKVAAFTCPCCVEVTRKNISLFDISKNSQTNLKCSADDCTSNPDSYNDFVGGNFDILYKMVDKLNDLNEQSQIKCHCNGDEIALDIRENQIVLTCIHCGKSLYINIDENSFTQLSLINSLLIT